jgi:hypothetical protein
MWRRALKIMAISYAVKTVLVLGIWLAAPDLVRQGRDKVKEIWASITGAATPAAAVVVPTAPARPAGAGLQPVGVPRAEPASAPAR